MSVTTTEFEGEYKTLAWIITILKRRRSFVFWPFLTIFLGAVLAAVTLPPKYQSTATILIEEPDVPREFVASTSRGYADQQIQIIYRRLMTIENTSSIADKFGLYRDGDGKPLPSIKLVEKFAEDMDMDLLGIETADPQSGQSGSSTIAFTLSFVSENPATAQNVTNELVTMFMNENQRAREVTAASTSQFLAEEALALEKELLELEERIAAFKQENEGSLPDSYQFNLSLIERSSRELTELTFRLQELGKRELEVISELSQISPSATRLAPDGTTIMSDSDRLQYLESELRRLTSVYHPTHPDVLAVKREISELKKKLQERGSKAPEDNPAYVMLRTQLRTIRLEKSGLTDRVTELRTIIDRHQELIKRTPQVEKEYQALMRDYGNANQKYQDVKVKQREAEMAQNLEQERKGQRLVLLEPASLPITPMKPNRPVIVVLGFVLAVGAGLGLAFVREVLDPGIYGDQAVEKLMGVPVMISVPYLETTREKAEQALKRKKLRVVTALLVLVVLGIVLWH